MERWGDKDYSTFSANVKFLGLDQDKIDDYFKELQSSGFSREGNSYSVKLYSYLRLGGIMCRVQVEQRENAELAEVYYSFRYLVDGEWPSDWQSIEIPAPKHTAIVGAFELGNWNDKESWHGSFRTRMRFLGADLDDYAAVLRQNGFSAPEHTGKRWELEKRLRVGGVWYRVTISDYGGDEIPEVQYMFREESN
jgi:hypothetical protein